MTLLAILMAFAALAAAVAAGSSAYQSWASSAHPYKAILMDRQIVAIQGVLFNLVNVHSDLVQLVSLAKNWQTALEQNPDLAEVWAIKPRATELRLGRTSEELRSAAKSWREALRPTPPIDPALASKSSSHLSLISAAISDLAQEATRYTERINPLRQASVDAMCVLPPDRMKVIEQAVKTSEDAVPLIAHFISRELLDEEALQTVETTIRRIVETLVDDLRISVDVGGLSEGLVHDLIRAPHRSPQFLREIDELYDESSASVVHQKR